MGCDSEGVARKISVGAAWLLGPRAESGTRPVRGRNRDLRLEHVLGPRGPYRRTIAYGARQGVRVGFLPRGKRKKRGGMQKSSVARAPAGKRGPLRGVGGEKKRVDPRGGLLGSLSCGRGARNRGGPSRRRHAPAWKGVDMPQASGWVPQGHGVSVVARLHNGKRNPTAGGGGHGDLRGRRVL